MALVSTLSKAMGAAAQPNVFGSAGTCHHACIEANEQSVLGSSCDKGAVGFWVLQPMPHMYLQTHILPDTLIS